MTTRFFIADKVWYEEGGGRLKIDVLLHGRSAPLRQVREHLGRTGYKLGLGAARHAARRP